MTAQLPIEFDKTPAQIITMDGALDALLVKVDETLNGFVPDLSTAKSRKEITTLSQKIVRTKTAIDTAGKDLTEEARRKLDAVNAVRKRARDELDKRRDQARKPLTDWEQEQEALEARRKSELQRLVDLGCVGFGATSQGIRDRIAAVEAFDLGDWWGDRIGKATAEKNRALGILRPQLQQAEVSEKQAAELAELKHQQAEAEAKRRAEEAKDRADREAEEAKAKQEREAELARQREEQRKAELAALEDRARKAEAERIEAEERRKQQAEAKRRDDETHHDKVVSDAVAAIVNQTGIPTIQAAAVVQLIEAGQVPNITLHF
nr:hypothetical protein [uncultured Cohaesibacter sp.]